MPKTKGDYYRTPKNIWQWECPFCGAQTTYPADNIWQEILTHLSIKHKEDFKIKKLRTFEYVAKKGWVEIPEP